MYNKKVTVVCLFLSFFAFFSVAATYATEPTQEQIATTIARKVRRRLIEKEKIALLPHVTTHILEKAEIKEDPKEKLLRRRIAEKLATTSRETSTEKTTQKEVGKKLETTQTGNQTATGVTYILFYGEGCSHCKNVERFLQQEENKGQFPLVKKEVWHNEGNQQLFIQATENL